MLLACAPWRADGPGHRRHRDGATLNGTITPSAVTCQQAGTPTTYQFQYGTTTAYGSVAPGAPAGVGAGTAPRPVAVAVTGLKPSTTYHVRVLARCADGARRFGRDLTFATTPPPPPTSKEQCKHGGWKNYPQFKNQGDCVAFVATAGKNEPSQAPPQRLARAGLGVVAPD